MIIDPLLLLAFIPAGLALNLTPGADMLFCFGQGLRGGPRVALAASAGISLGALVHTMLAGLGLGALVATYPPVFEAIRWLGVGYLVWLAVTTLRAPMTKPKDAPMAQIGYPFRGALLVNLTNPKVILFVLAFLPQFVDPSRPTLPQFLVLGAMLAIGGFIVNGAVGVLAGGIGRKLLQSDRFERGIRWASATVFGLLALRLAVMRQG